MSDTPAQLVLQKAFRDRQAQIDRDTLVAEIMKIKAARAQERAEAEHAARERERMMADLMNTPLRMYTTEEIEAKEREAKREASFRRITATEFYEMQVRVEQLEKQVKFLMSHIGPINITEHM